ncbi:MAG TPA: hypothetical protein VF789_32755 [Thermoanaerobaculia bacterium]
MSIVDLGGSPASLVGRRATAGGQFAGVGEWPAGRNGRPACSGGSSAEAGE